MQKKLNFKTCLGIITPSSPAPALFPERFKRGVNNLKKMGLEVKCGKYVLTRNGVVAATAEERANDINIMFLDQNVSLLMATIGGDYSAELLPYLNWEIIRENKKGIIGYSDITILLHAIGIKGQQVVYYGPTLMTEFAEYPVTPQISEDFFLETFGDADKLMISSIDNLLAKGDDWALPPKQRSTYCSVLQKVIRPGIAEGIVLGGCIEALERIRGTEFWPCLRNAILILETVDEEFNEKKWRSLIVDYTNMGVFRDVSGIIIGQKAWKEQEIEKLSIMFVEATKNKKIPILYGLPFGHISPIATIPLFTKAVLDVGAKRLLYEKPFKYEYVKE